MDIDPTVSIDVFQEHHFDVHGWNTDGKINNSNCRWVAMCSLIKEDVMELFLGNQEHDVLIRAE